MAASLDENESRGGLVAEQVKSRALLQRVVALSKERNEAALHLDALSRVLAGEPCNGAGGPSAGEGMKGGGCLSERLAALLTVAERMAAAAPSASAASGAALSVKGPSAAVSSYEFSSPVRSGPAI